MKTLHTRFSSLLALSLAVVIGCTGLTGCQPAPAEDTPPPAGESSGVPGPADPVPVPEGKPQETPAPTLQDVTFTYDDLTVEITNVAAVTGGYPLMEDGRHPMFQYRVTTRSVATVTNVDPTPDGEEPRWCFYKDGTQLEPGQAWTVPITPGMEPLPLDETIIGIARNPDFATVLELSYTDEAKPFVDGWDAPLTTQAQAEALQPRLRDILPAEAADAWFAGKKVLEQLFYTDGAYSIGQVYGRSKVDMSEPTEDFLYRTTILWDAFQSDMLKYFTPECFQWLLDNQMGYEADENGFLLCPGGSSGSVYAAANLGYVPLTIADDHIEFLEIASYQQISDGPGSPAEVHTLPCAMQHTPDGWRIATIYPYM